MARRRRARPTTRLLLTSWLVLTAAGTLLVVSVTVLWAEATALDQQLNGRARVLSQTLGAAVAAGTETELLASVPAPELRAGEVTDAAGETVWRYGPSDEELRAMAPDLVWVETIVPVAGVGLHRGPLTSRVAVSRVEIRQALVTTGSRVLVVLVGVLAVAVVIGLTLADRVVQPLQRLSGQLRSVGMETASGADLEPGATAELEEIAEAFGAMSHRLAEQRRTLEEGERRYRQLFQSSPAPLMELDADRRILGLNEAAEPFIASTPAEAIGRRVDDLLAPPGLDRFVAAAAVARDGGTDAVDARWLMPDGVSADVSLTVGRGPAGQLVVAIHDVTDRIRLLGERWRRTVEAMHDGVAVTNRAGEIVQANPPFASHLGTLGPEIGRRAADGRNQNWTCLSGARVLSCSLAWSPRGNEAVVVVRDITESVEAERRAREAERHSAMARVTAGVAHDFNNLLAGISVHLELAGRSDSPGEEAQAAIADLVAEGQEVVGEMLLLTGGVDATGAVDLGKLLLNHEGVLRHLVEGVARFELDLPHDPVCVDGNPVALRRVVTNLVVNARDAIAEGGGAHVTMRLRAEDGWAEIAVEDDGPGLPAAAQERVFEPFFTLRREGRGAGLGLAVVHAVVAEHHGTVAIDSQPGEGAKFVIRLPVLDPDMDRLAPGDVGAAVAVVDPAGERAAEVLEVLAAAGYVVRHGRTVEEALAVAGGSLDAVVVRADSSNREAMAALARLTVPVIALGDETGGLVAAAAGPQLVVAPDAGSLPSVLMSLGVG